MKRKGKEIMLEDINRLVELNQEIGINIGGEGGEYETLVRDAPMFKSRISITKAETDMENEYTGIYTVKKAVLEGK